MHTKCSNETPALRYKKKYAQCIGCNFNITPDSFFTSKYATSCTCLLLLLSLAQFMYSGKTEKNIQNEMKNKKINYNCDSVTQ